MKKKIMWTHFIIAIFVITGAIVLNTCPSIENWLHQVTGWY